MIAHDFRPIRLAWSAIFSRLTASLGIHVILLKGRIIAVKRIVLVTVFVCCFWSNITAEEQGQVKSLASSITEVTVYSDRARVTRSSTFDIEEGVATYAFQKLPGWIDEGSIRVALSPNNAGRITDVQIKRDYLARAGDDDLQKAESAVQEIADQTAALDDELKVLEAQRTQVEAIRMFSLEKLPKDAAFREIDVESYGQVVDFVAQSLREIAKAKRDINVMRRELQPELSARRRKLQELQQLSQLEQTAVLVTIEAEARQQLTLSLTYMLPGATWEPTHELRAQGDRPKEAVVSSYAVVTQTTGEDWDGVTISFSTQSSTETIHIPELDAVLLGDTRSVARIMGGQSQSFLEAQKTYEGQNVLWNYFVNPDQDGNNFMSNLEVQHDVQGRISQVFERLQKRGTTAHFVGRGKPTIRTDGRSIRVAIGEIDLAAESKIVAAPQASLNAARTVEMVNTGKQPLLPGNVSLFHDEAFLGITDVDFISEGESFAIFLGVADQIKLSRTLDRKHSSIVRGRRTRIQVAFEITVENLSDDEVLVSLADRIPVSQHKEISVDRVRIQPDVKPDSKGLLKWDVTLEPKETRVHRIEYRIEYPPAVVEQMRKYKGSASMPSDDLDLSIQIEKIESSF